MFTLTASIFSKLYVLIYVFVRVSPFHSFIAPPVLSAFLSLKTPYSCFHITRSYPQDPLAYKCTPGFGSLHAAL